MPNQYHLWNINIGFFILKSMKYSSHDNVPLLGGRSLIAPCSLTSNWFSHASFRLSQTSRIESLNDNPVPQLAVLQRYAALNLDGFRGSDLRLHDSPQNM